MNHVIVTLLFIVYGLVIILCMAKTDPRRHQLARKEKGRVPTSLDVRRNPRKLLVVALLLPFCLLVLLGNFAGILMYAGALTVLGWWVAELPVSMK